MPSKKHQAMNAQREAQLAEEHRVFMENLLLAVAEKLGLKISDFQKPEPAPEPVMEETEKESEEKSEE